MTALAAQPSSDSCHESPNLWSTGTTLSTINESVTALKAKCSANPGNTEPDTTRSRLKTPATAVSGNQIRRFGWEITKQAPVSTATGMAAKRARKLLKKAPRNSSSSTNGTRQAVLNIIMAASSS